MFACLCLRYWGKGIEFGWGMIQILQYLFEEEKLCLRAPASDIGVKVQPLVFRLALI